MPIRLKSRIDTTLFQPYYLPCISLLKNYSTMVRMKCLELKKVFMAMVLMLSSGSVFADEAAADGDFTPVRVMSFNIRYDNASDTGCCDWSVRRNGVAATILEEMPDVVGTQEVLKNQYDDLRERLKGYLSLGCGRDDGENAGEFEALWWRGDRWECVDSGHFWLSATPEVKGSLGWDGACVRMATWAKLRNRLTRQTLLALNTHLDHVGRKARSEGVKLIMERVAKLTADGKEAHAVVTGDFNCEPSGEPVMMMTSMRRRGHLINAHEVARSHEGPQWTFHDYGRVSEKKREIIDYVFVGRDAKVTKMKVTDNVGTLTSDHCPVTATLELPKRSKLRSVR